LVALCLVFFVLLFLLFGLFCLLCFGCFNPAGPRLIFNMCSFCERTSSIANYKIQKEKTWHYHTYKKKATHMRYLFHSYSKEIQYKLQYKYNTNTIQFNKFANYIFKSTSFRRVRFVCFVCVVSFVICLFCLFCDVSSLFAVCLCCACMQTQVVLWINGF
jgi:hypothetical protein